MKGRYFAELGIHDNVAQITRSLRHNSLSLKACRSFQYAVDDQELAVNGIR
jgi:hypothetical protein